MPIPSALHARVKRINIDEHSTFFSYEHWRGHFEGNAYLRRRLADIREVLGDTFTRSDLVRLYQRPDFGMETRFIAAMIWGHEAPAGSRRDSRGPWKLEQMFARPDEAVEAISGVSINSQAEIAAAYRSLDNALPRCGPNFFTKHFYFLGKALGQHRYPLIFDDRVAGGLVRLSAPSESVMQIVRVSTDRSASAYLSYLRLAHAQADVIECEPDQVEYFLFTLR